MTRPSGALKRRARSSQPWLLWKTLAEVYRPRLGPALQGLGLVFALAAIGSCSPLLGDVQVEQSALEPGKAAGSAGDPGAGRPARDPTANASGGVSGSLPEGAPQPVGFEGACGAGTVRCAGAALQLCSPDASRWITTSICASPTLCTMDPPACLPPVCALDELSCSGAVLQVCNANRDGWEPLETCASAAYCSPNARQCLAAPCVAGDLSCNREQLQRCTDDGLGWSSVALCETQALCELARAAGASSCPPAVCAVGDMRCVAGSLQRCNEGRSDWEVVEQCANAALCQLSLANGSAACESPHCATGEHRCVAEALTVCNGARTGFDTQQVCPSAALCDPAGGNCQAAACQPGARRCNGVQIETCNLDRTSFEPSGEAPCASASLCIQNPNNDVSCRDPVCTDGDFRCAAGGLLQRCSSTGDAFVDVRTCDTPQLCDATLGPLGCKPAACASGEVRCQGTSLLACRAARDGFDVLTDCGTAGCDATTLACRTETCRRNEERCNGARLEACNDARNGFDLVDTCASAALCRQNGNNARCVAPTCNPGDAECRRRGVLAVCNADQTGFDETDCGAGGCDDSGRTPRCAQR